MNKQDFKMPHRMTQAMLDVIAALPDLEEEYLLCLANELQANGPQAANSPLPNTSIEGKPVLHRSRLDMFAFAKYWRQRRQAMEELIPDATFEWQKEFDKANNVKTPQLL